MGIIILGTLLVSGGVTLLRRSGLPTALFLKQGVGMFHVGMQYPEYYRQWQDLRPLMRLIGLLEIEQISLKSVMQHLRELRVPVDKEQVEIALNSVASQGLLRFKDDDYSWARPLLARVLRSHVGSSGRFRLSEQIRHDHPLFKNVHRFLEHTGFSLTAIEGTSFYRCEPPVVLQSLLNSVVYALVMPGEVLDSKQVIAIHRNLQDIDEKASIVFVITDQRPTDQGWAQIGTLRMAGTIVLPIESGLIYEGLVNGSEMRVLRQEIEQRLGAEYDPYDVRDPVSRAFSFFGRDPLMGSIIRRLSQGRPVGVFGLRKLGKSSLLKALRGRVPFPVASVNLQTIGKPGLDELYARILRYWREWVRVQYEMDWKPGALSSDFTSATLSLLDNIERTTGKARLGLLLDEVELIVPCPDGTGPDLQRYLSFMRAMRGLVEEDGRLSLVVASLNPSLNRINTWKGQQNPVFSLFQEIYLPPLTKEDCTQMVRNIGRQIGLVYEDESVETIADLSGGHPFLARQFCSLLYKQRSYQPGEITADAIPAAVRDFIDDEQTVTHLDAGIWQDAGNAALWGEAQARINQAITLDLARADEPLSEESLLDAPDADARRTALINLDRFHFIHQPEPGYYALCYGLLRIWLRRRKLGLE
jgi:hypothetical protein